MVVVGDVAECQVAEDYSEGLAGVEVEDVVAVD